MDNIKIGIGNCFQTEEQAEKKAKELKEVLKKEIRCTLVFVYKLFMIKH